MAPGRRLATRASRTGFIWLVTLLDWGITAFTLALALWGYQQGLIVGALTLAGFALGAFAGSRIGPQILDRGSDSPYAPLFAALGALLAGVLVAVSMERLGLNLRARVIRGQAMHVADGAGGAALIAAVALGLVWVFGAVAIHAPGAANLRVDIQSSLILRRLNTVLPPTGPIINALGRVDPAPALASRPVEVPPPDSRIASDPDVRRAGASVVRVLGTACGLGVEGSGWVAAPGLVVTNAHVVAGEDATSVVTQAGTSVRATPVYFDSRNDLAILSIGLPLPPLEMTKPRRGAAAAVLGYPENGPFVAAPARFGGTEVVLSQDAYGRGPLRREIGSLRGSVRSGNSGGPLVDRNGRVLGTVFAATTSGDDGGFVVPDDVVAAALGVEHPDRVDTGDCA